MEELDSFRSWIGGFVAVWLGKLYTDKDAENVLAAWFTILFCFEWDGGA